MVAGDARDFARRAEDQRHALVQALGLEVEDAADRVGGGAARLLDQKGDRVRLVDEAQPALAIALALVAGIEEDAAAHQDAVASATSEAIQRMLKSRSRGPSAPFRQSST